MMVSGRDGGGSDDDDGGRSFLNETKQKIQN